jgi:hypothetical protein
MEAETENPERRPPAASDEAPPASPAPGDAAPPALAAPSAEAPAISPAPSARPRISAALESHAADALIIVALLGLFALVHRFVEVVEFGGDAVAKWQFVRKWWFHMDWAHATLDHHSGRMGVNALTWVAQALFGRDFRSYYVAPFFVAMLQLPFVYWVGKRLVNRLTGVMAVLLITYMETVHRSASQLLPDGYAGTYAIISTYLYVRFTEAKPERRRAWLVGLSLMAFVGYLGKETFVFFYPGFALALWMARRSVRDGVRELLTFFGILLAGLLTETALYAAFTKYHSRYAAIRGTHGATDNWPRVTFSELITERFAKLHNEWKYLIFFAFASALWLLVLNRKNEKLSRAFALIGLSHVFFLCFLMKGIHPIELWQSFEPRYMDPFTPFATLLSAALLSTVVAELWQLQSEGGAWVERFGPGQRPFTSAAWSLGLIGLLAALSYSDQTRDPPRSAIALGQRISKVVNRTYARNLPLVQRAIVKPKSLAVMYDVYLSDALLSKDAAGGLPDLDQVRKIEGNVTYLVKDPSVYGRRTFAKLREAGCVVEVAISRRGYQLTPFQEPPASCDLELQKAIE